MANERSNSRDAYLRGIRRRERAITAARWGILIGIIAVWEICARLGVIDSFLLSSPSRIASTIASLISKGELWEHLGVTLFETCAGFVLGGVIGTGLAIALWWSDFLSRTLDVYIVVINSLPKIALAPILIVWIGAGLPAIIAMAVLISVVVTLVTTLTGFQEVDGDKALLMRSFGASKLQILTMVILPASLPTMISALKLNIGLSWVGVIVGEFLVSRAGLGYLIVYGGQVFRLDLVMAATAILCALAVVMYYGISWLEKAAKKRV